MVVLLLLALALAFATFIWLVIWTFLSGIDHPLEERLGGVWFEMVAMFSEMSNGR